MQDPSAAAFQAAIKAAPKFPPEEQHLRCPRCDSTNTKFCYYNNYNLSQPRHFCKDCRRYWTKGGALRNIPVGGGTRKNSKRGASSSSSSSSPSASSSAKRCNNPPSSSAPAAVAVVSSIIVPSSQELLHSEGRKLVDADREMLDFTGSFSSLLTSTGHFGSLLDSFHAGVPAVLGAGDHPGHQITSSSLELHSPGDVSEISGSAPPHPAAQPEQPPMPDNLLGDSGCWSGSSGGGWPDLSIYTPGRLGLGGDPALGGFGHSRDKLREAAGGGRSPRRSWTIAGAVRSPRRRWKIAGARSRRGAHRRGCAQDCQLHRICRHKSALVISRV